MVMSCGGATLVSAQSYKKEGAAFELAHIFSSRLLGPSSESRHSQIIIILIINLDSSAHDRWRGHLRPHI